MFQNYFKLKKKNMSKYVRYTFLLLYSIQFDLRLISVLFAPLELIENFILI